MKIAFLFPGQGSVFPGMGRDLFTRWQACREIYEQASYVTGRDIAALSFNASRKRLIETANAHLVVFVHSLAVNAILQQHDITPDFLCGHSLGQFGAITAAEVLTMEEGLNLVKRRGTLLAANCNYRPGYMVAVRRCALNKIKAAIGTLGEDKLCIACFNGPDEIVVSGDRPTIRIAMRIFRHSGGSVSPL